MREVSGAGTCIAVFNGMRFVAIIVVLAIIYIVFTRMGPVTSVSEAMKEADAVEPVVAPTATPWAATKAQPARQSSGLRRPLDRTRAVLKQVRQRNREQSP
jgi:hypothetical protein